ncbi:hypothetical protein EDD53_1187 [Pacificibacter maritimus]|uniref:Uncharacterized protein n=1 Tax=Pacificibacter maritimus TaxID=762213 RepID=A0A3N4UPS3_9RHOB|nr:hypothetical protein EDD53_1187 [Pacificibacter maritimus]
MGVSQQFAQDFTQHAAHKQQNLLFNGADKRYFRAGQLVAHPQAGGAHSPLTVKGQARPYRTDMQKDADYAA